MDTQTAPETVSFLLTIGFYLFWAVFLLGGTWLLHWMGGRSR